MPFKMLPIPTLEEMEMGLRVGEERDHFTTPRVFSRPVASRNVSDYWEGVIIYHPRVGDVLI